MFKKSLIPIICIILFQTKLSTCFLPLFFDIEHETLKFVPVSETVIVNSLFLTDTIEEQDQVQDLENDDYFDKIQKLENNLNKEQNNFIHNYILNDQQNQSEIRNVEKAAQHQPEPDYIYIELNRNVKKRQAEDLLEYISKFTSIPIESFKELSVRDNVIIFLFDSKNTSASSLVNKILKYQLRISKDKGFEIVSCGLVSNSDKSKFSELKKSEQTKEIMIIFGIVSIVALCTLLIIVFIAYMFKKRYTNQDYFEKKITDEEELLISESKKEDSRWLAYVPFVKTKKTHEQSPVQDYQRMASKVSPINSAITPMPDAQTPALPSPSNCQVVNTNTINSTPIRITDTKAEQRNSSW